MKNKRLEERRKRIPKDIDLFVDRSFQIVDRIYQILSEQGMDQKTLAKALGKSESEISKWMTGTHNFTLKSLSKIETVLGQPIFELTGKVDEYEKFTKIDQFSITLKKQDSTSGYSFPANREYSYVPSFSEPSEFLS